MTRRKKARLILGWGLAAVVVAGGVWRAPVIAYWIGYMSKGDTPSLQLWGRPNLYGRAILREDGVLVRACETPATETHEAFLDGRNARTWDALREQYGDAYKQDVQRRGKAREDAELRAIKARLLEAPGQGR